LGTGLAQVLVTVAAGRLGATPSIGHGVSDSPAALVLGVAVCVHGAWLIRRAQVDAGRGYVSPKANAAQMVSPWKKWRSCLDHKKRAAVLWPVPQWGRELGGRAESGSRIRVCGA
jgi:hypothetical protein